MSEFLAEAQVLIIPNTATFAATLRAQLDKAVAEAGPVVIPVTTAPVTTGAAKVVAEETAIATGAIEQNTAALTAQGAAAQKASLAASNFGRTERLVAEGQALLAGASDVAALKTTELAAARSVLATTSHAVSVAEKAVTASLLTEDIALQGAAQGLLETATAHELNAKAAVRDAIAQRADATAAAATGLTHAQAARGIAAQTATLAGLRGATLAASAPFLVGTVAAILFTKAIKGASDATEEQNKASVVFGESAEQIRKFGETSARSLGISNTEALRSAAIFGNLFRTIKISQPVSADMSETLVRLAADLASFNNADPSQTLEALRSGLVGQARPLRIYGVFLSQARVNQQALVDTGKESIKQLTQAEIVQARYNIILRDSALAQGDFERTSDQAANRSRILRAEIGDLGEKLGDALIPPLTGILGLLNDYFQVANKAADGTRSFAEAVKGLPGPLGGAGSGVESLLGKATKLYFRFALLGPVIGGASLLVNRFAKDSEDAAPKVDFFAAQIGALTDAIAALQDIGAKPLKDITQQLNALEVGRLKIQTGLAPGGRGAEEANLRKQIEDDKKAVAASKSGTAARRKAIEDLRADQEDLARLIEEDASDARDRASRIEAAAREAAQAQADATQAFIDSFTGRQQRLENRLTRAALFGTANQQIKLNKALIAANKAEIEAIKDRIRRLHLHGEALKRALAAIKAAQQENIDTQNAILKLQAEQAQQIIDARQQHLEARLSIAETTTNAKDDAAALRALAAFDRIQIRRILAIKRRRKLTRDEAAELDAYRVDLAQRNEALRKAKEETKDAANAFAALQFEFMQSQQGFAANLISNLIPAGVLPGLVGGTASPAPSAQVAQASALAEARGSTTTQGQTAITIEILRQMLGELRAIRAGRSHPEAARQQHTGSTALETL